MIFRHTPDLLPDAIQATSADGDNHWFDLALLGHTHVGGQVTFFKAALPQYCAVDVGDRYSSGWLKKTAAILVSNGLARAFSRFGCLPSQLHLITLKTKPVSAARVVGDGFTNPTSSACGGVLHKLLKFSRRNNCLRRT